MKKLFFLWKALLAVLLTLCPTAIAAQLPLVEQISSNFITSFAEDPKGYIWIGTNHGLNRFSGSNYTVYYAQKEATALNSDYVNWNGFATGFSMEDFMIQELVPFVRHWFPVSDAPKDNFIAGLSMGGRGALMLGLKWPSRMSTWSMPMPLCSISRTDCSRLHRSQQEMREGV